MVLPVEAAPNVSGTYRDAVESIALYQKMATNAYVYSSSQLGLPTGYTLIDTQSDSATGFQAKTYRSISAKEVVVAYAGTDPGYDSPAEKLERLSQGQPVTLPSFINSMRSQIRNGILDVAAIVKGLAVLKNSGGSLASTLPDDLKTDWDLAQGGIPEPFNQALKYLDQAVANNRSYTVRTTGHSLGGAQALYVSAVRGKDAIAFNAPLLNAKLYSQIPVANRVSRSQGPFLLNLFAQTTDVFFTADAVSHPPSLLAQIMALKNDILIATSIPVGVKPSDVVDRVPAWVPVLGGYPVCHSLANFETSRLDLSLPSINRLKLTIGVMDSFTAKTQFSDVKASTAYEVYIVELVNAGLSVGKSPTFFGVNDALRRDEAATFLVGVAKTLNRIRGPGSTQCLPSPLQSYAFVDIDANNPHRDNIFTLAANGVVNAAPSDGKFRPADSVTSGELALMIMKAFKLPANGLTSYMDGAFKPPTFVIAPPPTTGTNSALVSSLQSLQKLPIFRKIPWRDTAEKAEAIVPSGMPMARNTDDVLDRGEASVIVANLFLFLKQNLLYRTLP